MSESTEGSEVSGEGPGAALRDAREALDVTTREVADALNLPVDVVEAMEANDYERLPQPVFTRGYLRSYARLLELDPAAIVDRYPHALEAPLESGEQALAAPEPSRSLPVEPRVLIAAGAAVFALLIVVWLWPGGEADPESPPAAVADAAADAQLGDEAESAAALAAAPEPAADSAPRPEDEEAQREPEDAVPEPAAAPIAAAGAPAAALPAAPEEREAASAAAAPPAPAPEPATQERPDAAAEALEAPTPPGFRRITPFGDDELVLSFAEDCWVQVRDLDGANLYGDLNRAGSTLRLIGRAPFRVRLGYAPGASLELNGEAVALTSFTRNNVANVVVGR